VIRDAAAAEVERWDDLVRANPDGGHILQSRGWGEFKAKHGWEPRHLVWEREAAAVAVLVLQRGFPGFGRMWYAPKGPGVTTEADLLAFCRDLAAMRPRAFAFRLEPDVENDAVSPDTLQAAGIVKAPSDIQINRATIILDLAPDEEALLNSFKSKTRYNIRLATRKEVTVAPVPPTPENLDAMYDMMGSTRDRAGFFLRPRAYYHGYWKLQAELGQGQLFLASYAGRPLAGAFVTWLGAKAWFKDGGSTREEQNRMPSYLLQWEIMRWLKARGVTSYDLVGVPPPHQMDASHSLFSLVQFKTGFSEDVTYYMGTWDLPLSPRYRWWAKLGERAAASIHRRRERDLLW